LFAANAPQRATDIALLAPLITLVFALPHLGHLIAVSIGQPQFGQVLALSDTSFPHSLHLIKAIIILLP